jgi:hypothetical protein
VFSSATSKSAKDFGKLASADEASIYAISTSDAIKEKLALTKDTVVVFKNFDEKRADLVLEDNEDFDSEKVSTFILGSSLPLIQEFSVEASKKIFSSPISKHVLIFTVKASTHHTSTLATYKTVAESFKGKALFVNVPSTETRVTEYFGVKTDDFPVMILSDMGSESGIKKYPYKGENEVDSVKAFLTEFFDGKLTPTLKSEEVTPEDTLG